MTNDAARAGVVHALLAVLAAGAGDAAAAQTLIFRAQQETRTTARRERQVVEIASLVVTGDQRRAAGLAFEHLTEFPADAELLTGVTKTSN